MNQQNHFLKNVAMCAGAVLVCAMVSCRRGSNDAVATTASDTQSKSEALRNVRTEPVSLSSFQRTIETTGTVAFNQNHSTQVLSPISGPVARIVVAVGSRVSHGEALAIVASPDFAADVGTLRKAEAIARNARHIADLDQQLFKNDAIARRDLEQAQTDAINAEADRDSAIQQLRALGVDERTIGSIRENRPVENLGGGSLGAAAAATFGLARGARDMPAADRRRRAALVYGVSVERFRKYHERIVMEQVAEEILKWCIASAPPRP